MHPVLVRPTLFVIMDSPSGRQISTGVSRFKPGLTHLKTLGVDLSGMKPTQLAIELKISNNEALEIFKIVKSCYNDAIKVTMSALDILKEEENLAKIITFSESIDELLGGGVSLGKITEFCGAPGIGKTQIGMQLAVDVQLPQSVGGVGGEAVYIDTEGSFIVERLAEIASSTITHCQQMARSTLDTAHSESVATFTIEPVLSHIHCYRCRDYVELLATVHLLPDFLKVHPRVRLVVVDSIAFHFRHGFTDFSLRTRLLTGLAQSFIRLATSHKLAVVLMNQMTTKFGDEKNSSSHLVPALGESWGHASTVRVVLYWEGVNRYAQLYKSPTHKEATAPFQITTAGIRDIVDSTQDIATDTVTDSQSPPKKRHRTDS